MSVLAPVRIRPALGGPRVTRLTAGSLAIGGLLLLYASWQLAGWGPASRRALIGDVFFYPVSAIAVWTAWRAGARCAAWHGLRRAWRLIALGALAYLLGDIAQTFYELAGQKPYPSLADGFYLAFYPLMLAGVLSFPALRRNRSERVRVALDVALVALGGSGAVIYLVLGPTAVADGQSALQTAFSIAYPVGDMVLLVGLASLLLRGSAPSARHALQLLAGGVAFYVAADLVYGWVTLHSTYQGGDPVDTLWMVAIAIMALAPAAQRAVAAPEQIETSRDRIGWVPYAAVAFGFAVLVVSDRHDTLFPGMTMTLIALGLAALVSARQFLGQRDLLGAQGRLRHQALHDALTGLPNRVLMLDRAEQLLARARRDRKAVAMLFIDIDRFKQVNDTFGHAAGDKLLCAVAARLSGVVREADTLGRLGGDEFVVLLDPASLNVAPELVAERALDVLRLPIELNGSDQRSLSITASVGIAAGPRDTAEELMHDADIALYRAKEAGRDGYVRFESEMQALVEDRLVLELDLQEGIAREELFLEYQPTFNLRDGTVTGVEALVRWRHPTRGVLAPETFVPLAEQTRLIVPLGRWVLHEACRQAADWHGRGHAIGVAVNVSGRQLERDDFADHVDEALRASGLDPASLTLEITETSLMADADSAAERLASLKALGLRVAIDDFGTGYSSLAYLRQFPVDALKIDRSFISSIASSRESGALIHTLVQLGKTLGLETLGEGIEDADQLRRLQREQCDHGQGFLLARPLCVEAIERFLDNTRTAARGLRQAGA
jgi:diguanylate cyclase (GGDEF)-like protein